MVAREGGQVFFSGDRCGPSSLGSLNPGKLRELAKLGVSEKPKRISLLIHSESFGVRTGGVIEDKCYFVELCTLENCVILSAKNLLAYQ